MKSTCTIREVDGVLKDTICHHCAGLLRWVRAYYQHDEKAINAITPSTSFRQLSTDSLDWADWLTEMEDKLHVILPDQVLDHLFTIGDMIRELRKQGVVWPDNHDLQLLPRSLCSSYHWEVVSRD
ncbi:MAG: acyl carrier protein [Planctomycetia bacterium]|nr:acyl carrier protein [Planctomycetia bacterium]